MRQQVHQYYTNYKRTITFLFKICYPNNIKKIHLAGVLPNYTYEDYKHWEGDEKKPLFLAYQTRIMPSSSALLTAPSVVSLPITTAMAGNPRAFPITTALS